MKIVLDGSEAEQYLAVRRLYDLHEAIETAQKMSEMFRLSFADKFEAFDSLMKIVKAYLDECTRLNAEYRKEQS